MSSSRSAVIVGGGITGILTARQLLLDGWKVTVLEGLHVGAGSSSRTAAGIRQQFSTRETVVGMRFSVDFYTAFQAEVEDGQSPLVQNGYLFLHDDEAAWSDAMTRVQMQQNAGLKDVVALAGPALFDRFPWLDKEEVLGGTWCPSDGFLLPAIIYQEGARRVRELGGKIVQRAPVTGADVVNGRITALKTPKGRAQGDVYLDCTNAWTTRLGEVLGAMPLPVAPLKRYLWFVKRDGGMSGRELMKMPLVVAPSGVYGRPENAETLLMGWAHQATPEPAFRNEDQDIVEPAYAHDTGIDTLPYEAWMNMATVVPPIGDFAGVIATTAGYYGTTPDHNPFLGYDQNLGNLIRLVGFSGHGAMFGPFTAVVASALADAGRDIEAIALPHGTVSLDSFATTRDTTGHSESMVI